MQWLSASGRKIILHEGDITQVAVDAMVNAANSALIGGGGVVGAFHRAGGPGIMRELEAIRAAIGSCPTGKAVATGAGRLPAKFVFHAVGPVYRDGCHGEPELLAGCYKSVFKIARENGIRSLAFPAISCGVYRFPVERAVKIAVGETVAELISSDAIQKVIFACFGDEIFQAYQRAVDGIS